MNTTTDGKFRFIGMAALATVMFCAGGYVSAQAGQWSGWPPASDPSGSTSGWSQSDQSRGWPAQGDAWAGNDGASPAPHSDSGHWDGQSPGGGAWSGRLRGGAGWGGDYERQPNARDRDRGAEAGTEEQYGQRTWANMGSPDRGGRRGRRDRPQASYWHHDPGTPYGYGPRYGAPMGGTGAFGFSPYGYGGYGYGTPYGGHGLGGSPFTWGGVPGFNPFGFW